MDHLCWIIQTPIVFPCLIGGWLVINPIPWGGLQIPIIRKFLIKRWDEFYPLYKELIDPGTFDKWAVTSSPLVVCYYIGDEKLPSLSHEKKHPETCFYIYPWNPNDPWPLNGVEGPSFGGFKLTPKMQDIHRLEGPFGGSKLDPSFWVGWIPLKVMGWDGMNLAWELPRFF